MKTKCLYCEKEFEQTHGSQKYCSTDCRNKRNYKVTNQKYESKTNVKRVCKWCGKEYVGRSYYYCSSDCSKNAIAGRQRKLNKNTEYIKKCVECDKEFITIYPNQICCNKECGMKRIRNSDSQKLSRKLQKKKEGRIQNKLHEKFKGRKIEYSITLKKLIKRDNNICHICGKECDSNDFIEVNGNIICGNNYPSIDHVIPAAKGGNHTWENVKLAHRICNSIKSDKL